MLVLLFLKELEEDQVKGIKPMSEIKFKLIAKPNSFILRINRSVLVPCHSLFPIFKPAVNLKLL